MGAWSRGRTSRRRAPGARVGTPRQHNRRDTLLAAAAAVIAARGYDATSMRDIAQAAGMQPGSLYYHYASKDELFVAVHESAIAAIVAAVETAVAAHDDPWARMEAAAAAHLEALLGSRSTATIVSPDFPVSSARVRARLVAQRDAYERRFHALVDALPLPRGTNRALVRLMLLGALNWTPRWYRTGRMSPGEIGRGFVRLLRRKP
jgi:TetR/AcrR family transcriptional regulator, cholesterol catabolism regulator